MSDFRAGERYRLGLVETRRAGPVADDWTGEVVELVMPWGSGDLWMCEREGGGVFITSEERLRASARLRD